MATDYSISFEAVELLNGFAEDKSVWLFMRASLFNDNDPKTPLWTADVGSLPPDSNRPPLEGFPYGDNGRYADHLIRYQQVRNDDALSGHPRFTLPFVSIEDEGQYLELIVWMLPKVWLEKKRVKKSKFDRAVLDAFVKDLVGSFVGIPAGLIDFIADLFGDDDEQTVDVPCLQSIILARHVFRAADLSDLWASGPLQCGPADNDSSAVCANIDSFYYLSATIPVIPPFSDSPQPAKAPCVLAPRAYTPRDEQLVGRWGDRGDNVADHVRVSVSIDNDAATVRIWEHRTARADFEEVWNQCTIVRDTPAPPFYRNVYDDIIIPAATVRPTCPFCSKFSNLDHPLVLPPGLFSAGLRPGTHVGTRPTFSVQIDTDVPTAPPQRLTTDHPDRRPGAAPPTSPRLPEPGRRLGINNLYRERPDGRMEVWPAGQGLPVRSGGLNASAIKRIRDLEIPLPEWLAVSWIIVGPDGSFAASYAEVNEGKKCVERLRYVRMGDGGQPKVDLMLMRLPKPIA